MARGFSRLLFPRFGVGEGRFEPEVKGHVKEGPHFGGMNLPRLGPCNDSLTPRAPRGEGARGLGMGNAPFLEASRRSSKEGGARSREAYKGAQDAKFSCLRGGFFFVVLVVSSGGLLGRDLRLVAACLWRSGPWNDPFVGARGRWGVRAWHQGHGL